MNRKELEQEIIGCCNEIVNAVQSGAIGWKETEEYICSCAERILELVIGTDGYYLEYK